MSKWRVDMYYDGELEHYYRGGDNLFDTKLQAQAFRNDEQDWDAKNLSKRASARYTYEIVEVDDE